MGRKTAQQLTLLKTSGSKQHTPSAAPVFSSARQNAGASAFLFPSRITKIQRRVYTYAHMHAYVCVYLYTHAYIYIYMHVYKKTPPPFFTKTRVTVWNSVTLIAAVSRIFTYNSNYARCASLNLFAYSSQSPFYFYKHTPSSSLSCPHIKQNASPNRSLRARGAFFCCLLFGHHRWFF